MFSWHKPVDTQVLDGSSGSAALPISPSAKKSSTAGAGSGIFFGGGAMTDLFTHWIDVVPGP